MLIRIIPDELLEKLNPKGYTVLVTESALTGLCKEDAAKIRAYDGKTVEDNVYYHDEADIYLDVVWDADRALARFCELQGE